MEGGKWGLKLKIEKEVRKILYSQHQIHKVHE
jgi:hypothetical protein